MALLCPHDQNVAHKEKEIYIFSYVVLCYKPMQMP